MKLRAVMKKQADVVPGVLTLSEKCEGVVLDKVYLELEPDEEVVVCAETRVMRIELVGVEVLKDLSTRAGRDSARRLLVELQACWDVDHRNGGTRR